MAEGTGFWPLSAKNAGFADAPSAIVSPPKSAGAFSKAGAGGGGGLVSKVGSDAWPSGMVSLFGRGGGGELAAPTAGLNGPGAVARDTGDAVGGGNAGGGAVALAPVTPI